LEKLMFATGRRLLKTVFALGLLGLVSACATTGPASDGIVDPYENTNRKIHNFNTGLDRALIKPASTAYGIAIPGSIKQGVSNFASNASLPQKFVNNVLQGDIEGAGQNFFRFSANTLFGFAGLLDPATDMGIAEADTDFGETLAVWGVGEGAYVVLPLLGPSTQRDATGKVVDLFTNPLSNQLQQPERYLPPTANVAKGFGNRYRYSATIDSILYDSADPYAQSRLVYLQNSRFSSGTQDGASTDPYEDPYDSFAQ
jgi:phospholipid-binding lipoprotein MlaA